MAAMLTRAAGRQWLSASTHQPAELSSARAECCRGPTAHSRGAFFAGDCGRRLLRPRSGPRVTRGPAAPTVTRALFGGLFGGGKESPGGGSSSSSSVKQEPAPLALENFLVTPSVEAARGAGPQPAADGPIEAAVRPLLEDTVLSDAAIVCAYDANIDGWTAPAFHKAVDHHGPALLLGRTQGGAVFGAWNPIGWGSREDYRDSNYARLLAFAGAPAAEPRPLGPAGAPGGAIAGAVAAAGAPQLLARVGPPALFDFGAEGPTFGADGLKIPLGFAPSMGASYAAVSEALGQGGAKLAAGKPSRRARSRLGSHYARRPDGGKTLFSKAEGMDAELTHLAVWVGVGLEGEYF